VIACADCGHPLPADALFCTNCGAAAERSEENGELEEEPAGESAA
jgi:predicted amidophosphoribosyltransferase